MKPKCPKGYRVVESDGSCKYKRTGENCAFFGISNRCANFNCCPQDDKKLYACIKLKAKK